MEIKKRRIIRYSEAFKHQVVREIESGDRTIQEAKRAYGIDGGQTIQRWMRRMGRFGSLPRIIRVEKPKERDRIKELERQIKTLKEALADTQVERIIAESRFEVVCEQQGWDPEEVKKKLQAKLRSKQGPKK
jgi:transposase-like protein